MINHVQFEEEKNQLFDQGQTEKNLHRLSERLAPLGAS